MAEGTYRVSKLMKEFNIGKDTIIEFLAKKSIAVDNNPNAKISQEAYSLLASEFQSEKAAKEKRQATKEERLERKTITLENISKPTDAEEDDADQYEESTDLLIKNVTESSAASNAALIFEAEPEAEVKQEFKAIVEEVVTQEIIVEEPVKTEETPKADQQIAISPIEIVANPDGDADNGDKGPKVLGRIDLASMNLKNRPTKKKKEEEPKVAAPAPASVEKVSAPEVPAEVVAVPEIVEESVSAAKEEPTVAETPAAPIVAVEPETSAKINDGVIRPNVQKLEGVTVIGKIQLPVKEDKKKQPIASSAENKDLARPKKKKRKRIAKEGETSPKPTTGGTGTPTSGQHRPGGGPNNTRPRSGPNPRGGSSAPAPKAELTEEQIQNQIRETLARLSGSGKSKAAKYRRAKRDMVSERLQEEKAMRDEDKMVLKVTEFVTANELANMMNVSVTEVISACMSLGMFVSINQRLNAETLAIISEEFGYKVEFVSAEISESILEAEDQESELIARSPIVTVMGHVDHGKTSLLDYVRKANVIAGEAGGITQHIGAYNVKLENGKSITFLDTPGHEAFTAMRARGAQVTDIAIIVVAADDSVMPQTKEAINHAQAAGVPMVFAINKIDKPGANPDKIREALAAMNILVEEWGGKFQCQEISAKKGLNIELLLEKVLLEAELLELKANPAKNAKGTVIESTLDKGRGYVTTLLVSGGTLKVGDVILAGQNYGRVKAMFNERGVPVIAAGPAQPVSLLGFNGAPNAGEKFNVLDDEKEARNIANKREQLQREQGMRTRKHITIEEIGRRLAIGNFKELNLIVKGDVDGSVEALSDSLLKLSSEKIQVNVIHKSVGQISESDVLLASASDAIIVGFQVRPSASARKLAENEEIDIRLYSVIYDAIEEIKAAMEGMLDPKVEEKIVCNIEVRDVFKITKVGTVAGCYVLDGKITRNTKIRLIRDGIVIYAGELGSLKRFKDDVREVNAGYECGLNINNFNDIKEGDIIEGYDEVEVKQKL